MTTNYLPLSDEEWAAIQTLIMNELGETPNRRGRPRADIRASTNAILHCITANTHINAIRNTKDYPSGPTLRRFMDFMRDRELLACVATLLHATRPDLQKLVKRYQPVHGKQVVAPTSFGFNFTTLPWGKPLGLSHPVLVDDGDGY